MTGCNTCTCACAAGTTHYGSRRPRQQDRQVEQLHTVVVIIHSSSTTTSSTVCGYQNLGHPEVLEQGHNARGVRWIILGVGLPAF